MKLSQELLLAKKNRSLKMHETENVEAFDAELCHMAQEDRCLACPTPFPSTGYGWFSRG